MLSTRDPPQTQEYVQTESEGLEKDIPCKWKSRVSYNGNNHIRQIDFKIKTVKKDKMDST